MKEKLIGINRRRKKSISVNEGVIVFENCLNESVQFFVQVFETFLRSKMLENEEFIKSSMKVHSFFLLTKN